MADDGDETMAGNVEAGGARRGSRWRIVFWSAAALVLLLPLVAMQFTDEVQWAASDFVFAGALLGGIGLMYELAVRRTDDTAYRAAAGIALAAVLLLVWISLGVGIIGADGDPANLLYAGVLAVGIVGAVVARFRPRGMARAMFATALAQASVAAGAVVAHLGSPYSGPIELVVLNGFFVALFAGSAVLFRRAAREHAPSDAGRAR
ncbi:MAG TPA: hypothetical protein VK002_12135 [Rubricoccaceae bacterium]|jgi:hypothetical protein|nr:hypothetical protein [Rubricoccaceae bacterium]